MLHVRGAVQGPLRTTSGEKKSLFPRHLRRDEARSWTAEEPQLGVFRHGLAVLRPVPPARYDEAQEGTSAFSDKDAATIRRGDVMLIAEHSSEEHRAVVATWCALDAGDGEKSTDRRRAEVQARETTNSNKGVGSRGFPCFGVIRRSGSVAYHQPGEPLSEGLCGKEGELVRVRGSGGRVVRPTRQSELSVAEGARGVQHGRASATRTQERVRLASVEARQLEAVTPQTTIAKPTILRTSRWKDTVVKFWRRHSQWNRKEEEGEGSDEGF